MSNEPLAELATVSGQETTTATVLEAETRQIFRPAQLGFITMFVGVVLGIIGKMVIHVDIVTVVGVLLSVAGMFMIAYPFLLPTARRKPNAGSSSQPEVLAPAEPTKKLPQMSDINFIPSVTEGTTELLKTPTTTSRD